MAVYVRYAHKAEKIELKLDEARDRKEIATNIVGITILHKPAIAFILTFVFYDGTELKLDQDELSEGDTLRWDIHRLLITHPSQPGQVLKFLAEYQIQRG